MKHGVFSYFLTEGLQGAADYDRDSAIGIMEASKYTFEKVTSWALANSRIQSPTLECSIYGDVILCQVPSDYHPISTEIAVKTIRLCTTTMTQDECRGSLSKICGVLINFIEPNAIHMESEGKEVVLRLPQGRVEMSLLATEDYYLDFYFDYDVENRKIIDKVIPRLNSSEGVDFDIIEFFLSHGMDLNRAVKSFRKRGFEILSYEPSASQKIIVVQLPSELGEKDCTMEIREKAQGVSILFSHKDRFDLNFYDKINPKSVMEFSALVQEK